MMHKIKRPGKQAVIFCNKEVCNCACMCVCVLSLHLWVDPVSYFCQWQLKRNSCRIADCTFSHWFSSGCCTVTPLLYTIHQQILKGEGVLGCYCQNSIRIVYVIPKKNIFCTCRFSHPHPLKPKLCFSFNLPIHQGVQRAYVFMSHQAWSFRPFKISVAVCGKTEKCWIWGYK